MFYTLRTRPKNLHHPAYYSSNSVHRVTHNVMDADKADKPFNISEHALPFWEIIAVLDDGTEIPLTEG